MVSLCASPSPQALVLSSFLPPPPRCPPFVQVRKLSKRFGMFHGMSNLLNLVGLICGLIHASTLGSRLAL